MRRLGTVFKALSDETRLTIMALVFRHGHLCVCEVEQVLGITQSKASRHLRYLRDAGVLEDARDGLIVNYRVPGLPEAHVSAVLALLRALLADRPVPEARQLLVQLRTARAAVGSQSVVPAQVLGTAAAAVAARAGANADARLQPAAEPS